MSVVMQGPLLLYRPTDCNAAQAHRSGRLRDLKSFPFIKPRKAKSLAISRLLAFSISIVPHNVPQILGVFEVPKNQ